MVDEAIAHACLVQFAFMTEKRRRLTEEDTPVILIS